MRRLLFRPRAIFACLWFGLLPWQAYETTCHYKGMSYGKHALLNMESVWIYLTVRELPPGQIRFELRVNKL